MSKYKPLYSSIWTDNEFENYSPEKKLLFIFLITNQYVEKSGIYRLSLRQISFHTGTSSELINEFINEFINEGKINYDFKKSIIFIKNVFHYQKGVIKNENILLLTIKRNYELVKTEFWDEFFDVYSDEPIVSKIKDLLINGSLMAHQLYINNNKDKGKDNNKDKKKNVEKKIKKPKGFTSPSLEEVKNYCLERKNSVNPEKWLNYYQSNGWKVGKNPMKDWKAAIRTWENSDFGNKKINKHNNFEEQDYYAGTEGFEVC